jgi:hypothetical protein
MKKLHSCRLQLALIAFACVLGYAGCGSTAGTPHTTADAAPDSQADAATARFSFFVTSLQAMRRLSNSDNGFGGDLRFGETGPGAGLRGADKICATIAESSLSGVGQKQWRAFLSVVADETGAQVNAIDRIGEGPWYDRTGRKVALRKADLLYDQPSSADGAIQNDLPNEDGVPNHAPVPSLGQVNNRSTLTGSNDQGVLYGASSTCQDWTSTSSTDGRPRAGYSWSDTSDAGTTGGAPGFMFDGGFPPDFDGGFPPDIDGGFVGPLGGEIPPDGGIPTGFGPNGGLPPGFGGMDTAVENWISAADLGGCAPGVNLGATSTQADSSVASNGGYGGIYCFALTP